MQPNRMPSAVTKAAKVIGLTSAGCLIGWHGLTVSSGGGLVLGVILIWAAASIMGD